MNVVYKIQSDCGKVYVGSTGNLEKRISTHYQQLKNGYHHNINLQKLYDSGSNFTLTFNACHNREEAYELEELIIAGLIHDECLLNIGMSAKGGDNFTRNPNKEEIRKKYALAMLSLDDEERIRRFSNPGEKNGMFGKTHTAEVRELCRKINLGNKYRLGKLASLETRKRISEVASQRTGDKNSFFGCKHSDDTKKRIALKRIGLKPSNTNRIEIDNVLYESQADAAKALGVSVGTITFRIKSKNPKFSNYRVISK